MKVTLYTQPSCQPCKRIKHLFDREGVPYEAVDLSQDHQALDAVKELGYARAPVTIVRPTGADTDIHWGGLNPFKIEHHIINPHKENKA